MYSYLMEDIPFLSFSFAFSGKMVGAKTEARADVIKLIPEISSFLMLKLNGNKKINKYNLLKSIINNIGRKSAISK